MMQKKVRETLCTVRQDRRYAIVRNSGTSMGDDWRSDPHGATVNVRMWHTRLVRYVGAALPLLSKSDRRC